MIAPLQGPSVYSPPPVVKLVEPLAEALDLVELLIAAAEALGIEPDQGVANDGPGRGPRRGGDAS